MKSDQPAGYSRRHLLAALAVSPAAALSARQAAAAGPASLEPAAADTARPIDTFLPAGFARNRQDWTPVIEQAWKWSADNRTPVSIAGRLSLASTVRLEADNGHFVFDHARLTVTESSQLARISNGRQGPIGILVTAKNAKLLGDMSLIGLGVPKRTRLAGMVFDHAHGVEVGTYRCRNLAAGRFVFWCDGAKFGSVHAVNMHGRQTFEEGGQGTAGSAEVVMGCQSSVFGDVVALENYKPCRYLSNSGPIEGKLIDNRDCSFGSTTGTASTDMAESSLLAVRSAVDCRFGDVTGIGGSSGLLIVSYDNDHGLNVDRNRFGWVHHDAPDTDASVDAVIALDRAANSPEIGSQWIAGVSGSGNGEFGLFMNSGRLVLGSAELNGFRTPLYVDNAELQCGDAVIRGKCSIVVKGKNNPRGRIESLQLPQGASVDGVALPPAGDKRAATTLRIDRLEWAADQRCDSVFARMADKLEATAIRAADALRGR